MNLLDSDVISTLEKAQDMIELYELHVRAADASERSIDDFEWLFKEYLDRTVSVHDLRLPADDRVIRGMYAAMEDGSYNIFLLTELGDRERRFILCKELFHVVLDDEQKRNMDLLAHLEEATVSFSIEDSTPNSPVACEALAEIAAMEFLFPYKKRLACLQACGADPDYSAVARRFGVPQAYVEEYLSRRMMAEFANLQWRGSP